jgi:hypothetical protein
MFIIRTKHNRKLFFRIIFKTRWLRASVPTDQFSVARRQTPPTQQTTFRFATKTLQTIENKSKRNLMNAQRVEKKSSKRIVRARARIRQTQTTTTTTTAAAAAKGNYIGIDDNNNNNIQ